MSRTLVCGCSGPPSDASAGCRRPRAREVRLGRLLHRRRRLDRARGAARRRAPASRDVAILRRRAERARAARRHRREVRRRRGDGRLRGARRAGQLEALVRAREHAVAAGGVRRQIEADALLMGPYVDARLGDFDLGREKLERSKEICRELGIAYGLAEAHMARAMCHAPLGRSQTARRSPRSMARRTVAGCSRRGGPRRRPCGSTATRPAPGVLALRATPAT